MNTLPQDLDNLSRTAIAGWQPLAAGMFRAAAADIRAGDERIAAKRLLAVAAHGPAPYLRGEALDIGGRIVGVSKAVAAVVAEIGLDLDGVQEACRRRHPGRAGQTWFVGLAALVDAGVITTDAMQKIGARRAGCPLPASIQQQGDGRLGY